MLIQRNKDKKRQNKKKTDRKIRKKYIDRNKNEKKYILP